MRRRTSLFALLCVFVVGRLCAQSIAGVEIHGFATQGLLYSSNNNYLTMGSDNGSAAWTDGALTASDSLTEKLRAGIQLHMYQLGELGGPHLEVDWASGDYRVNDYFGIRAGKVKTPIGLFNDSQDVDAIFLWTLLPQSAYPIDNKSFLLSHIGFEAYGGVSLSHRAGKIEYRGYAGHNSLASDGGYAKLLDEAGAKFANPPGGKIYGGDLRWEAPLKGLTLGFSGLISALDGARAGIRFHLPASFGNAEYAQLQKRKFYFAGEYRRLPTNADVIFGPAVFAQPTDQRTWFAMGSYRVRGKFQVGSYYSHYVNKGPGTMVPSNYSKDWVASARYDFSSYLYGKVEEHILHGTGLGYYADTNPTGLKPDSKILAVKLGFSF